MVAFPQVTVLHYKRMTMTRPYLNPSLENAFRDVMVNDIRWKGDLLDGLDSSALDLFSNHNYLHLGSSLHRLSCEFGTAPAPCTQFS